MRPSKLTAMTKTRLPSSSMIKCVCCKLIFPSNANRHHIFGEHDAAPSLQQMLTSFLMKPIVEKIGTEQAICDNCLAQLEQSYAFQMRCLNLPESDEDDERLTEGDDDYAECFVSPKVVKETDRLIESDIMKTENVDPDDWLQSTDSLEEFAGSPESKHNANISNPEESNSFAECIDINLIKNCIRNGIPIHQGKRTTFITNGALSTKSNGKRRGKTVAFRKETEDLDKESHSDDLPQSLPHPNAQLNIDQYLQSLVSVRFGQMDELKCCKCTTSLPNYTELSDHVVQFHHNELDGTFECCLVDSCQPLDNWVDLLNHWYSMHIDLLKGCTLLTCNCCNNSFESVVTFGKHICQLNLAELPDEHDKDGPRKCEKCYLKCASKMRFLFHQQFHLTNSRPTVCLVCDIQYTDERFFYEHVMFAHERTYVTFCRYCDQTFADPEELELHDVVHKRFECAKCGQRFFSSQCLQSHKETHASGFYCDYCQKMYKRKSRLVKHMLLCHVPQHPKDLPSCHVCHQLFPNQQLAELHVKAKHSVEAASSKPLLMSKLIDKVFVCEYCESAFHTTALLKQHKDLAHTSDGLPQFECVHCAVQFDQYGKLKTHYNSHDDLKALFTVPSWYCCEYCPKQFRSWRSCQVHRKNLHLSGVSVIECSDCGSGFHRIADYEFHRKHAHNKHCSHTCPICERTFNTTGSLDRHLTTKHIENRPRKKRKNEFQHVADDGTISCLKCGHIAKSAQMLRIHVQRTHKGSQTAFTCEVCQQVCARKQTLQEHMATHMDVKPFECSICGHRVCSAAQLTCHKRKHFSERPFSCDECPKSFKQLKFLRRHKVTHVGIKNFQCSQCDLAYFSSSSLYNHVNRRHNNTDDINRPKKTRKTANSVFTVNVLPGPQTN